MDFHQRRPLRDEASNAVEGDSGEVRRLFRRAIKGSAVVSSHPVCLVAVPDGAKATEGRYGEGGIVTNG